MVNTNVKRLRVCTALYGKPSAELRSVICHMGSHRVTCHPTQLSAPRRNPCRILTNRSVKS